MWNSQLGIGFSPLGYSSDEFEWMRFHSKLKRVRTIALVINMLYTLNWFLGFCAVTWATTIILGGTISDLKQRDYFSVSVLLLLEAMRLAASRYFVWANKRAVVSDRFSSMTKTLTNIFVTHIFSRIGLSMELVIIVVCVLVPARRLRDVHYEMKPDSPANFNTTLISLQIFYSVVLVNAVIAVIRACSYVGIEYISDRFLRRYYHRIVWNGNENGLLYSTEGLDDLQFAFEMIAEDCKDNSPTPELAKEFQLDGLVNYLYNHPYQKGFEAATVALESDNTFVREAAANVVGWWINFEPSDEGKILMLQEALLSKLADALEHQGTGRAAAFSFEQMAHKFPKKTVKVRNSRDHWLVDILIKRIHEAVLEDMPNMAFVFLKIVAVLVKKGVFSANNGIGTFSDAKSWDVLFSTLRSDLLKIACHPKADKRTLVIADYSLFLLSPGDNMKFEELSEIRYNLLTVELWELFPYQYLLEDEKEVYLKAVLDFLNRSQLGDRFTEIDLLQRHWNGRMFVVERRFQPARDIGLNLNLLWIISSWINHAFGFILLVVVIILLFFIFKNRVTF